LRQANENKASHTVFSGQKNTVWGGVFARNRPARTHSGHNEAMPGHAPALELRLFGSPVVRVNDQDERVNLKKLFGLVAYLSLEGATPRSRLAGLLWSDLDEESARRNLRRELVRVKTHASVLEGRFTTEGERLKLTEPWSSDAQTFEAALARDDLETALEVYRGPLLDGFEIAGADGFHGWLEIKREQYVRLYRKVMLDLAERLETRGDWRRALELHQRSLEADKLQERTHREVMRLHALLGEREAALTQFERCREMLGGELGLEPLPETVLLAERIRSVQTPAPITNFGLDGNRTPQMVVQVVTVEAPLVGREAELEQLHAHAGAVMVLGEPGVGKTRLLTEFAATQDTVWVRFTEASSAVPLEAVARTISHALEQPDGRERLMQLERVWRLEVARLVPDIEPGAQIASVSSPEVRARFLEGVARALLALGACLILEDLHWADAMSLELTQMILPKLEANKDEHRLILSARPAELEANEAAADLTTQLGWANKLERVTLNPLAASDVRALVMHNAHRNTGFNQDFMARLMQSTQGNPLFVLESLRYVLERPASFENLPVPPTVREAVLERTKRLGNAARRLLETASLTDDGFMLREVQPATALSDWEGVDGLERAVSAQILTKFGRGGYAFAHDLVRQAIAGNLGTERQMIIHSKLAQTLEAQGAAPARIARHLEGAGQRSEAAPWRIAAAEAAERIYAHQEALEQYRQALEDDTGDHTARAVHLGRGEIFMTLLQLEHARAEYDRLEEIAQATKNTHVLAEVWLKQATLVARCGHHAEALERRDRVLEMPDLSPALRASALEASAPNLMIFRRDQEAETRLHQALEVAPPEDRALRSSIHERLCLLTLKRQEYATAATHIATALSESRAAGDRQLHGYNLNAAARLALARGDPAEAIALLNQGIEEAQEIGDVNLQHTLLVNVVRLHVTNGALDAAQQRIEEGLALVAAPRDPRTEGALQHRLGDVRVLQGHLGKAIEAYQASIVCADAGAQLDQKRFRRGVLAHLYITLGNASESLRLLTEFERLLKPQEVHHDYETTQAALELLEGHVEAAMARLEQRVEDTGYGYADSIELTRCLLGMARLAQGNAVGALEITEGIGASVSLMAMALSVRLQAHVMLGQDATKELRTGLHEAESLLLTAQVPPLVTLGLRRTIASAFEAVGQPDAALAIRAQARETLHQLAASLEDHPHLHVVFLEKNRDLR
jgi:DNA-binding SARP family transcriptional activator/predicted ATPase